MVSLNIESPKLMIKRLFRKALPADLLSAYKQRIDKRMAK